MAEFPTNIYNPETVAEFFNEVLDTYLPIEGFATIDKTLVSKPGLEVTIWRYNDTGSAEKLEYQEGNEYYSDAEGYSYKYQPKRVQDRVAIYDDDISLNPNVANYKMGIAPKHLINTMRADVVDAWYETDNYFETTDADGIPTVSELILAQSELDLGIDGGLNNGNGGERLCLFFSPKDYRKFQAYLATNNVIVASEVINGKKYTTVAGIPFQASDFIRDGQPVFATDAAVRLCYNQCKPTGSERDENHCKSTYYARTYYVAALEFLKKACILGKPVGIAKSVTGGTADIKSYGMPGTRCYIRSITPTTAGQEATIVVKTGTTVGSGDAVELLPDNSFVVPDDGANVTITFA